MSLVSTLVVSTTYPALPSSSLSTNSKSPSVSSLTDLMLDVIVSVNLEVLVPAVNEIESSLTLITGLVVSFSTSGVVVVSTTEVSTELVCLDVQPVNVSVNTLLAINNVFHTSIIL